MYLTEEISREKYSLVIGTVVHLEVDDGFFNEAGEMDYERAMPLPPTVVMQFSVEEQ
jgi:flavin reductase (DIM6/NTAB) family NADH-FMN oxidoreductase RutF